jgi:S-adenosylmethionine decarboxylase
LVFKCLNDNFKHYFRRELIEEVLNLVNCKVLKYAQSTTTDTYVLSESSMFVFRSHFVLKTCGETTLLHAVQPILELARNYCEFDLVDVKTN